MNEVNCYGEKKTSVENTGSRLMELSRKEDCDVIQNLIMTVQDRYKKLQQRTAERVKALEEVKKNARQVLTFTFQRLLHQQFSGTLTLTGVIGSSCCSSMNPGACWWTG